MARLDSAQWETIRAEYEIGASQSELSEKHGVSRAAIQKRIKKEGWTQEGVESTIRRKVAEKVAGVVAGSNPKKRAEAIDAAAGRAAAVVTRHQAEWVDHAVLVNAAVKKKDFDLAKLAKITAETIMIRQTGERRAHGLDKESGGQQSLGEFLESLK